MKGKLWKKALSALTSAVMLASALPAQLLPDLTGQPVLSASASSGENYVQIGSDSTGMTVQGLPVTGWYSWGWSEQIYSVAEVGNISEINSIAFYVMNGYNREYTMSLYLMDTSMSNFNNDYRGVSETEATCVWSGQPDFKTSGWSKIDFQSTYQHDPSQNLMVIAIYNCSNPSQSINPSFRAFDTQDYEAIDWMTNDVTEALPGQNTRGRNLSEKNTIRLYGPDSENIREIGVNSATTYSYQDCPFPTDSFGYAEQIYTAEEVGDTSRISAIDFNITTPVDGCVGTLYLKDTDRAYFDNYNADTLDGAVKVYSGSLPFDQSGWVTVNLDRVYHHDPSKNMMLIGVNENKLDQKMKTLVYNPGDKPRGLVYKLSIESDVREPREGDTGSLPYYRNMIRLTSPDPLSIEVKYHPNYAEGTDSYYSRLYHSGEGFEVASNLFGQDGYAMTGWNTEPDGSGTFYSCQQALSTGFTSDTDLWAQWEKIPAQNVQIGVRSCTGSYFPLYSHYNYGWSEQIYTAAEIGSVSKIEALSFNIVTPRPQPKICELYLMDTAKTGFASENDTISVSDATLVYSGDLSISQAGWMTIDFNQVFMHDPSKNLAVIMVNRTGSYDNIADFACFRQSGMNVSAYYYEDNNPVIPGSTSYSVSDLRNVIRLKCASADDVTVGMLCGVNSASLPLNSYYKFGYTEQIYLSEELGEIPTIGGLGFYVVNPMADRKAEIYLMDTDKREFTDEYDSVPIDNAVKVYDGIMPFTGTGWVPLELSTEFTHDPSKNLMLIVINKTADFERGLQCAVDSNDTKHHSIYKCSDDARIDPDPSISANVTSNRNVIRFFKQLPALKTVTFMANDGSGSDYTQSLLPDSSTGLLPNTFTRVDYDFVEWNTKPDGTGTSYADREMVSISSDLTLYAQWQRIPENEKQIGAESGKTQYYPLYSYYKYGFTEQIYTAAEIGDFSFIKSLSFKVLDPLGFTFKGKLYLADTDKTTFTGAKDYITLDDATLVYDGALPFGETGWSKIALTETYVHDPSKNLAVILVNTTASISSGLTFADYGNGSIGNSTIAYRTDNQYIEPGTEDNISGYGYSRKNVIRLETDDSLETGRLIYKANGGTGDDITRLFAKNTPFKLKGEVFTREGWYMTEWNTKADGSGTTYALDETVTWTFTNRTLYAQWKQMKKTTYKANGGEGADVVQYFKPGDTFNLKDATLFKREGYLLTSWNTKADGSGTEFELGKTVTRTTNLTLYAQWKELNKITYKANGGDGADVVQYFNAGDTFNLKDATLFKREGYLLTSWNTKADGSGTEFELGKTVTRTTNLTLHAQWKQLNKITYKANGGEGEDVVQYFESGDTFNLKGGTLFKREGYYISAWNSKPDGSGTEFELGKTVTRTTNLTLHAQWKALQKITFKSNDGTNRNHVQYFEPSADFRLNANPFPRDGYYVESWNTKADGSGTRFEDIQQINRKTALTLYAQWKLGVEVIDPDHHAALDYVIQGMPFHDYYRYNYTVQIQSASDIGDIVCMSALSFYAASNEGNSREIELYLADIDASITELDYPCPVTLSEAKKVYSGTFSITNTGWVKLAFDELYTHDPLKSLLIICIDRTGSYVNSATKFTILNTGNTAYYLYNDDAPTVPHDGNSTGNYSYSNEIRIDGVDPSQCVNVTYKANGGEGADRSMGFYINKATSLPSNTFTRPGYLFDGWNTKANGTGTAYTDNQTVTLKKNLTLYAQWKACKWIAYHPNGGKGIVYQQNIDSTSVSILSNQFTKFGNSFAGWNTKADGTGTQYAPGETVSFTANTNLYAQWAITTVYDFSVDPIESGWTFIDNDGDEFNWLYPRDPAVDWNLKSHSGDDDGTVLCSESYSNDYSMILTPDNWAVAPAGKVVSSGTPFVYLWAIGQDASYPSENFAIYAAEKSKVDLNNFDISKWTKVSEDYTATAEWAEYSANLSAFKGKTVYIAIRHYNVSDMFRLNIDDVALPFESTTPQVSGPQFRTKNMTLSGAISMNFFVDLSMLNAEQRNASYVEFTVAGKTTRADFDPNFMNSKKTYYGFNCPLTSVSMADPITAVLHYNDGHGDKTVTEIYNVETYFSLFSSEDGAATWNLIRSLNDYGYYMQQYLSQASAKPWSLGIAHKAMRRAYRTSFNTEAMAADIENLKKTQTLKADISKVSMSLLADSETALKLNITPADGYTGPISATVDGENVEVVKSGSRYQIVISNIAPKNLGKMFTVKIKTSAGTSTVKVSVMSYVYLGLTNPDSTNELNAMAAMYNYYKAAIAY